MDLESRLFGDGSFFVEKYAYFALLKTERFRRNSLLHFRADCAIMYHIYFLHPMKRGNIQ